ncbi:MAG: glycosyltransferase family 2 protein [Bacteroidetes bacterium]|nr:MAG: glycosyltransferase family 2 protein [Bacteroidota bacterium]TAE70980.1 MAG: glycosyltransferase family 2 protein [Bacteroidota bacterium]TAF93333.1 MAG: glycosyltransferase family 2 protein [Bacteroidota bacterium]
MQIAGFTIIKNALLNDYPVKEAILSVLPVVDKMYVFVGKSDDETLPYIQSFATEKIEIVETVWDDSVRTGGTILAIETNKAFDYIPAQYTWAFYIQADEAVHEQYYPAIKAACETWKNDTNVQGLLFNYLHFYGTYNYVGDSRKWYHKEVRIIRNNKAIRSYKDAQGFRINQQKLPVKPIDACIYHYGWVKTPQQMDRKLKQVTKYWNNDNPEFVEWVNSADNFDYSEFDSLAKFTGTHPQVYLPRIAAQNLHLELDVNRKKMSLKNKFLYWFEKQTGLRLFDFKNYKIV